MKRSMKYGLAAGLLLFMAGCGGDGGTPKAGHHSVDEYRAVDGKNGIDFFAVKDDRDDANCFYMGNGPLPPWESTNYKPKKLVVFLGNDARRNVPGYRRFQLNAESGFTEESFLERLDKDGFERVDELVAGLNNSAFSAYSHSNEELAIGPKLQRLSNPGDIVIPWYSEIIFILKDNHERFNPENPLRVAVGVPGGISPFYGPPTLSRGGKVLKVKYLSMPERDYLDFDDIKRRDCIYYYELSLVQRHTDNAGRSFEFVVHLDPDGENDNGPGDDDWPPTWP